MEPRSNTLAQPGGFRRHYVVHRLQGAGSKSAEGRPESRDDSPTPPAGSTRRPPPAYKSTSASSDDPDQGAAGPSSRGRHYAEHTTLVEQLLRVQRVYAGFAGSPAGGGSWAAGQLGLDPRLSSPLLMPPRERGPAGGQGVADTGCLVLMIVKGFAGGAVLYLPRCFANGGLLLAGSSLVLVGLASTVCMRRLLDCAGVLMEREAAGGKGSSGGRVPSYGDISEAAFGPAGRIFVDASIVASQLGFCATYFIFVGANFRDVTAVLSSCWLLPQERSLYPFLLLIWVPLAWVRRLSVFAATSLVADAFVLLGLVVILGAASWTLMAHPPVQLLEWAKTDTYALSLGTAVYAFEGIGLVLPMYEATDPALRPRFKSTLTWALAGVTASFVLFAAFVYASFRGHTRTIVLQNMPRGGPLRVTVQFAYGVAIVLSYPLMLYPVTSLVEARLFPDRARGRVPFEYTYRNVFRTALVGLTMVVAMYGANTLDNLVALIGAVACCPLALIYPAVLHYRVVGDKSTVDVLIAAVGAFLMIFSTFAALTSWGSPVSAEPYSHPICPPKNAVPLATFLLRQFHLA